MTEQPQPLSTKSASDGATAPEQKESGRKRLFGIFRFRRTGQGGKTDKPGIKAPKAGADKAGADTAGVDKAGAGTAGADTAGADRTETGKSESATADKPSTALSASKIETPAANDGSAAGPKVADVATASAEPGSTVAEGVKTSDPDKTRDGDGTAAGAGKSDADPAAVTSPAAGPEGTEEAGEGKRKRKELPDTRPPGAPPDPWTAFATIATEKPPGRIRRGFRALGRGLVHEYLLAVYLSALFAVALTWPTLRYPLHTLPQDLGDPSRQAWQISWLGHVLQTNPVKLWQTNAYFPTTDSLAYGDSLLGYAPAGLLGTGPEAAVLRYNILFVLAHALLLFGAYVLVRQLGARRTGAAVAAAAFAYAPWRLAQEGHLDIVSAGAIPLALALLARGHGWSIRYGFRPALRNSGWAALGWLVAIWQFSLGFSLGVPFAYVLGGIVLFLLVAVRIRRFRQQLRERRRRAGSGKNALGRWKIGKREKSKEAGRTEQNKKEPGKAEASRSEQDKEPGQLGKDEKESSKAEAGEPKHAKVESDKAQIGQAGIVKAEPAKAEPAKAEPAKGEPAKAEPDRTAAGKAEPGSTDAGKTEPGSTDAGKDRAEPGKAETTPGKEEPATAEAAADKAKLGKDKPGEAEPDKGEPDKAEPDKAEPDKAEPGKAEPGKAEPGKAEPGKAGKDSKDGKDSKGKAGKKKPAVKPVRKAWRPSPVLGWRLMLADSLGVLLFAGVAVVLAIPYLRVPDSPTRGTEIDFFSPQWRSLLIGPAESRIWGAAHATPRASLGWAAEMSLLPGFMLYALALAGLLFSIWRWRQRLFLVLGLAVSVILTLGTTFFDGRWTYLPLFGHLSASFDQRIPGRLMLWTTLLLAILAGGAVDEFVRRAEQLAAQRTPPWPGPWLRLATLLPLLLVALEGWNATAHPVTPDQPAALRTVGGPMLVLPTDALRDQTVQLWTTSRYQQVANGGGNVVAARQAELRAKVAAFPDLTSIEYLRSIGVVTVLLIRADVPGTSWEQAGDLPVDSLGIRREDLPDAVVFHLQ
jgi:hypothetical protein